MTRETMPSPVVDDRLEQVLRRLLQLDPVVAARIRDRTPARPRPRPQIGPSADYR